MYFVFELYYKQTQKADNVVGVDASSENLAQFFLLINECCENVVIEFSIPIRISFSQHSQSLVASGFGKRIFDGSVLWKFWHRHI